MKWFVSRKSFDAAVASAINWYNRYIDTLKDLHDAEALLRATQAELETAVSAYNAMRELEQQERHRRLMLQGEVQYRDERMRRALGLITTPPPAPSVDDGWDVEKAG